MREVSLSPYERDLARRLHGATLIVEITDPFGSDDGDSIEFNANVISITPETPHDR
jgi:hypothetical protein